MPLSPRKRVEIALRGGCGPEVPFTAYDNHLPRCGAERVLRNMGMCSVVRMPVFKIKRPDVRVRQEVFFEGEKKLVRTHYSTPEGNLSTLEEPAPHTTWHLEKMFKSPDDYKAIRFLLSNERYEPDYGPFALARERYGGDGIFRAGLGPEPMQALISGNIFSTENFCLEWMDNRDEVLSLYEINVRNRREIYPVVARSPALHANYGGNVVPEIVGADNFRDYYIPHYNEAAEIMHEHGKLIGSHFDANCGKFSDMIAKSMLDYIEAFTPSPDSDMTLKEARRAWKGKAIWLNFPSSVHLGSEEKVENTALKLVDEAGSPDGLIMGITEDVPEDRWQGNFLAIMRGLQKHARMKPELYRKQNS